MLQILGSEDHDPYALSPCDSHPPDFYPIKQRNVTHSLRTESQIGFQSAILNFATLSKFLPQCLPVFSVLTKAVELELPPRRIMHNNQHIFIKPCEKCQRLYIINVNGRCRFVRFYVDGHFSNQDHFMLSFFSLKLLCPPIIFVWFFLFNFILV